MVEFDKVDQEAALDFWMAVGINGDKSREEQAKELFAWWTLAKRGE